MNPLRSLTPKRKGVALFFILATIMIITIMVYGLIFLLRSEVHLTENYVDGTVALMLAEAGIDEGLFTIKKQMNTANNPIYKMITTSDEQSLPIDLGILEGRAAGIEPLIKEGHVKGRLSWKRNPDAAKEVAAAGLPADLIRGGWLTIEAMGEFHGTKRQVMLKKEVKAVRVQRTFPGDSVGMIAPSHGLYFNDTHPDSFKVKPFDFWDPWGFTVKGGRVYAKNGAVVDLTKWMMLTQFKNELQHPWLDMGMGWTGWNGGATFYDTQKVEYSDQPIDRHYNKWQGLFNWPWWASVREPYNANTTKVEAYEDKQINLYPNNVYKRLANRVVDPVENPTHGKYFQDIHFREAYGTQQVTYNKVVPLYGYGNWRNVPAKYAGWLSNPTKAHDTSRAVEINGLTYIKGDVFLEGWVKGKGLLVVEGNIYIGGDVVTLPDDKGEPSSVGIIAVRDTQFDHSKENPLTGKIVYKPHHDSDWSRFGITHPFIDYTPHWEGSFYAQGGFNTDTDSKMKKLINLEVIGNLASDYFDRSKLPNDVTVKYFNWQEILSQSSYDFSVNKKTGLSEKYEVSVKKEIIGWREVEATM